MKTSRYGVKVCYSDGGHSSKFCALGGLCSWWPSTGRSVHVGQQLIFFFYLALCSEGLMFEYKSDGGGAQFFYCIYQSLCAGVGAAR